MAAPFLPQIVAGGGAGRRALATPLAIVGCVGLATLPRHDAPDAFPKLLGGIAGVPVVANAGLKATAAGWSLWAAKAEETAALRGARGAPRTGDLAATTTSVTMYPGMRGTHVIINEGAEIAAAEGVEGEVVSLFRVVEPAELADIQALHAFRNPFGIESKYFSTVAEGAAREAKLLAGFSGTGPFTLVETSIPRSVLPTLPPGSILSVDRGLSTVVLGSEHLPFLSPPNVWTHIPLP